MSFDATLRPTVNLSPVQDSAESSTGLRMATKAAINSSTLSSSQPPQVHNIKVGVGGFQFDPAELEDVKVGDTVTFEFYPPDHSVARAEFGSPCIPYEYTGREKQGFWSGTQWVKDVDHVRRIQILFVAPNNDPAFVFQHHNQLDRTYLLLLRCTRGVYQPTNDRCNQF